MMMDDELDELFGDAPQLQLPPPISKGLLQSVDDLRLSGCCQKIAWSNNGCIAYISHDSRTVNLRHLYCSPKDGQWNLSKQYQESEVSRVHNGNRLVHLSWNHAGNDIAIVDIFGKISIFTVQAPITSRINVSRPCMSDPEDHLGAVVGLTWLNTDRMPTLYRPAIKENGQWSLKASQHKLMGPHNPNAQKPALVAVTRGGMIRLLLQDKQLRWHDLRTEIDSVSSSLGLLSHAAMSADKDSTMLLVTHSVDKQLRLYRVSIDSQQLQFSVQHLKSVSACSPLDQANTAPLVNSEALCQLSHLALIPHGPETRTREPTSAFIFAVFSYVPDQYQNNSIREEPFSILARWELHSAKPKLHPCFEQLTSKKSNASYPAKDLPSKISLKRLRDVTVNSLLLYVQEACLSTVLAMTYSDGTIEFRDRTSMDILPRDDSTKQVSSMTQVGFDFPDVGACLHAALSPNLCAVVSISEAHDVKLSLTQLPLNILDGAIGNAIVEAVTEAFALQFAIACNSSPGGSQIDDLLAVIQLFSRQLSSTRAEKEEFERNLKENFLSEIYRVLDVGIDYSTGSDTNTENLFRNGLSQRCLGMQLSLGYSGDQQHRSMSAKAAWSILNLRFTSLILIYTLKYYKQESNQIKKIELVRPLLGVVQWSLALMAFITDALFILGNLIVDHGRIDKALLDSQIRKSNTPALSLILISSSRALLKWNCRYLRGWKAEMRTAVNSEALRHALREFESILDNAWVDLPHFERIISEMDTVINNTYMSSKMSDAERKKTEREMLVSAAIPSVILPGLQSYLVESPVGQVRKEIDEAGLYFMDNTWLGLSDDGVTEQWKREHFLDVLTKLVLPKTTPVWRCVRCCAVMEPTRSPQGRSCVCNGWWMVE